MGFLGNLVRTLLDIFREIFFNVNRVKGYLLCFDWVEKKVKADGAGKQICQIPGYQLL